MSGDPPGLFTHCQNFPTPEAVLELIEYSCEIERAIDPGVEVDTIIVNNDVGWERGNKFLDSVNDTRTYSGRFKVIHRENYGRSFGGYNRAHELFRDHYDYWTFTEDDILIVGHQYFKRCIEAFNKHERTGFVAIQGLSREHRLHAHGGVGTTRIDVLNAVRAKFNKLPHCERHRPQDMSAIIFEGEIAFTNAIAELGFSLVTAESPEPLYSYAYDHMRGRRFAGTVGTMPFQTASSSKRHVSAEELEGRSPREKFELLQMDRDIAFFYPVPVGQAIWDMVMRHRPGIMIEFGVYRGYTSIIAALAMDALNHGHLLARDWWEEGRRDGFDEQQLALSHFVKYQVAHRVSLEKRDFWDWIKNPEPCDLLYFDIHNDGDKIKAMFNGLRPRIETGLEVYFEGGSIVKDRDDEAHGRTPIHSIRHEVGFQVVSSEPPGLSRISLSKEFEQFDQVAALAKAHAAIDFLNSETAELRKKIKILEEQEGAAREDAHRLRMSTCWRLTGPLRAVLDRLRGIIR
ncbi:class I SAM-dependent methyltransferase [bacterium]|nr:class I SAM-dependent methyltransferase [bacterium]